VHSRAVDPSCANRAATLADPVLAPRYKQNTPHPRPSLFYLCTTLAVASQTPHAPQSLFRVPTWRSISISLLRALPVYFHAASPFGKTHANRSKRGTEKLKFVSAACERFFLCTREEVSCPVASHSPRQHWLTMSGVVSDVPKFPRRSYCQV
jgi:hypothetical protein